MTDRHAIVEQRRRRRALERRALGVELARALDRVLQPRAPLVFALLRLNVGAVHLLRFLEEHGRIVAQLVEHLQLLREPHQEHAGGAHHQLGEADARLVPGRTAIRNRLIGIGVDDRERFALERDRHRQGEGGRPAKRRAAAVFELVAHQLLEAA